MSFVTNKQERIRFLKFAFVGGHGNHRRFWTDEPPAACLRCPPDLGSGNFFHRGCFQQLPLEQILDLSGFKVEGRPSAIASVFPDQRGWDWSPHTPHHLVGQSHPGHA